MSDYRQVEQALESGAEPAMLCMTCPWDRFCVQPPSMTSAEVKAQIDKASKEDDRRANEARANGKPPEMPMGGILTALMVGGRERQAPICPVLALRLRTEDGQGIVSALKTHMKSHTQS